MKFSDLKAIVDKLTPEQLDQEVVFWGCDEELEPSLSGTVVSISPVGSDHVYDGTEWVDATYNPADSALFGDGRRLPKGTPVLEVKHDQAEELADALEYWVDNM